jgi:hypothetical protein
MLLALVMQWNAWVSHYCALECLLECLVCQEATSGFPAKQVGGLRNFSAGRSS